MVIGLSGLPCLIPTSLFYKLLPLGPGLFGVQTSPGTKITHLFLPQSASGPASPPLFGIQISSGRSDHPCFGIFCARAKTPSPGIFFKQSPAARSAPRYFFKTAPGQKAAAPCSEKNIRAPWPGLVWRPNKGGIDRSELVRRPNRCRPC